MKKIFILLYLSSTLATASNMNGYVENIMLPDGSQLAAKLDTGADTSSLNVQHVKIFQKNKKPWVSFDVYNKTTLLKHDSYPVLKMIGIKNRSSESGSKNKLDKRPLIAMPVCLGNQVKIIQVNLVDRQQFAYSFLLGREAMRQFKVTMDPSKKYINPLQCPLKYSHGK